MTVQVIAKLVERQRHVAAVTHGLPAANLAAHNRCVATAIFENDGLLFPLKRFPDGVDEDLGELRIVRQTVLAQIDELQLGELHVLVA